MTHTCQIIADPFSFGMKGGKFLFGVAIFRTTAWALH
jgi:hypothetical protein